jgi:coenzyme F420-reducing hydrogenase alpha subunit
LRLQLAWNGQKIVAAHITATRPLAASLLVGQAPERAVALVPRLFSLCGQAQGVAARLALRAARGESTTAEELERAVCSVALEAIGEHLWRLLLDWPALLGQSVRKDAFLSWRKRLLAVGDASAAAVLGAELKHWLEQEQRQSFEPVLGLRLTLTQIALLPWLSATEWAQQLIDEAFSKLPHFSGRPAETGVLARQAENAEVAELRGAGLGIAARLTARYADLRDLADGLIAPDLLAKWVEAAPCGEACGLARVETARGVLLHLIQVRDLKVQRYVIVAPTEWNFHPQGAFVQEIIGVAATSRAQAEAAARSLALALDPCVDIRIEIQEL